MEEWDVDGPICAFCREPFGECICPPDYDENDEADEQLAIEMEERD